MILANNQGKFRNFMLDSRDYVDQITDFPVILHPRVPFFSVTRWHQVFRYGIGGGFIKTP